MLKVPTNEQLDQWDRDGAVWPVVDLLTAEEAADYTRRSRLWKHLWRPRHRLGLRMKAHTPFHGCGGSGDAPSAG